MTKKIFKSILLVSASVLVLGLAFVMSILYSYFGRQLNTELKKEAAYLSAGVEQSGEEYLESITNTESRITYIDEAGNVLYDSDADEADMENHGHREEVMEAFQKGTGQAERMSDTLQESTFYYAVLLENGNVLRVSSTQYSILKLILELVQPMLWILLLMLVLSGVFAFRISRKVVEPVNNLDLENPEENHAYAEVEPLLSKIYKQKRQITSQLESARRQQEEFSVITENMQEGLLVIDRHTMVLSVNSSVSRLFGVSGVNVGQSVYTLNRSEQFRKVVESVLEGRHCADVIQVEGSAIQMIANPVTHDGEIEGAVLLFVNVTEKVSRENLRREFSANVSHELKTPLTSISGFAEIMQDGFVKEEDIKKFAARIYKEAQRLIQLVEDTIKISQLDEGEIPYEKESVDLYRVSKDIFESLKEQAERQNVSLYIDGERTIMRTVRPILEEVLYNLCDNAIKYNRQDGNVTITLSENAREIRIGVKDTGIGIPVEDQNRVFERFYRVDKSHSKEIGGTGLGLSIVKHGVGFLGAKLKFASEEGKGTEITLVFPKIL